MGRLFDAVSSLLGLRHEATYEAQAAIELEGRARAAGRCRGYRFGMDDAGFDAAPVIAEIVADLRAGVDTGEIAGRFHQGVADLIRDAAVRERQLSGLETVVLGGGVFQNVLLLSAARRLLLDAGFEVKVASRLPPNDGGLALGQLMIAATR